MARRKEDSQAFTVKFPKSLVEEIDLICSSQYITRTSWLIRAAKNLLENERMQRSEDLLNKLVEKEKKDAERK